MEQNITMQKLKEQRLTPAERFVLETIKDVKPKEPDEYGNVRWCEKDYKWLFTQYFKKGYLWVSGYVISSVLQKDYGLNNEEIEQLLTRLLYKYSKNGQLKIKI
jgi:hypothetical protein